MLLQRTLLRESGRLGGVALIGRLELALTAAEAEAEVARGGGGGPLPAACAPLQCECSVPLSPAYARRPPARSLLARRLAAA